MFTPSPVGVQTVQTAWRIVISVCLSFCTCLSFYSRSSKTACSNVTKYSVCVTCGRGLVLFWWRYGKLCISSFVHDLVFSNNGPNNGVSLQQQPLTAASCTERYSGIGCVLP